MRSFGKHYENEHFMMNNKILKNHDDNIILNGEVHVGTPGLWTLIILYRMTRFTLERPVCGR